MSLEKSNYGIDKVLKFLFIFQNHIRRFFL